MTGRKNDPTSFVPNHLRRARYRRQNATTRLTPAQERRIRAKSHREAGMGLEDPQTVTEGV